VTSHAGRRALTASSLDRRANCADDVIARGGRGEAKDEPSAQLQLVLTRPVARERAACAVRVPAVVLDRDLQLRVREVDAKRSTSDADAVLDDRSGEPRVDDPPAISRWANCSS
jgi:hypothetical protein